MPGNSPLLALSYPVTTDQASPAAVQTLAAQVEKYLVGVFATTAARDAAWTAAGGVQTGAVAYITGTGELTLRASSGWLTIGGRASPFATAAGTGTIAITTGDAAASNTITFPSGRFSQAPIVTMTPTSLAAGMAPWQARATSITTTNFAAWAVITSGTAATGLSFGFQWQAVQMTSTAAAG